MQPKVAKSGQEWSKKTKKGFSHPPFGSRIALHRLASPLRLLFVGCFWHFFCHFWPPLTLFMLFLANFGNFWPFLAAFGCFLLLLLAPLGYLGLLLVASSHLLFDCFWLLLARLAIFWPSLALLWPFLVIFSHFGHFWLLLGCF